MNQRLRFPIFVLCAILCFFAVPCLFAQGQQQSQQQTNPPPQTQTQKPSLKNPAQNAAPPVDPKEEAAYKAFYDMKPSTSAEYDTQIQSGEAFLKDFPQSRYRASVDSRLTHAYFEKHDLEKMYGAANNDLALNPDDITVLSLVGWVIPRGNPSAPDFSQQLAKAEQYEKHALDLLATLKKPDNLTDDQFTKAKNNVISQAHSGLGMVYFREAKYDESSTELQKATEGIDNPDPTDFFVLGIDLEDLQKYPDSVKAFDSCAQAQSPLQDRCKQGSAEAKAKEGAAPPHKP